MPVERWLPVAGYEGLYEVSDQGQVRSRHPRFGTHGRILKPVLAGRGRHTVVLHRDGIRDARYIHHLVLETFVGPRPPGLLACHSNDEPQDNRVVNLRWDTASANQRDAVRNKRHAQRNKTHCRNKHPLTGINLYTAPDGSRVCRACNRDAARTYKLRQKVKEAA